VHLNAYAEKNHHCGSRKDVQEGSVEMSHCWTPFCIAPQGVDKPVGLNPALLRVEAK
jgi:hypothetical protein